MPPSFPTTSPVAIATTRILAAYLSNHRLSPTEAASLSEIIVTTLAELTGDADGLVRSRSAAAQEPKARRQAAPRAPRQARAVAPVEPVRLKLAAAPDADADADADGDAELDLDPEREAEAMAEPPPLANHQPEDGPVPPVQSVQAAEAEAGADEGLPRKRKRPSRPRSKRGQVSAAASASDAATGAAPEDGASEDEASEDGASENEAVGTPEVGEAPPQSVAADPATDPAAARDAVAPKPRRTATRSRRAAAS